MTPFKLPTIWLINGPVLFLYIAAGGITLLLCKINEGIGASTAQSKPLSPAVVFALAFASNLLGIASLVLLAHALSSAMRLSMLALPLLLLLDRYGKAIYAAPRNWHGPASSVIGSIGGSAIGAWLFMRKDMTTEPFGHAVIPPDVKTVPLSEVIKGNSDWTISLDILVFYLVSMSVFYALHALIQRAARKLMSRPAEKRQMSAAFSVLVAFAFNFLGVFVLVFLARHADVQTRLAMVALPLLLIVESYVKLLRVEPQNRAEHWTGLIGSCAGMILAACASLRGAPLH